MVFRSDRRGLALDEAEGDCDLFRYEHLGRSPRCGGSAGRSRYARSPRGRGRSSRASASSTASRRCRRSRPRATSSGMRSPDSCSTRSAPSAMASLNATSAVELGPRSPGTSRIPSAPLRRCHEPTGTTRRSSYGDVRRRERLAVPLEAERGRADDLAGMRAERDDALRRPELSRCSVAARAPSVFRIVTWSRGAVKIAVTEEHDRSGHLGDQVDVGLGRGSARCRARRRPSAARGCRTTSISCCAVVAELLDQHGEAALAGGPHDRVGQLGEVGVAEVRDHQRDHVGAPGAQAARRQVRGVAEARRSRRAPCGGSLRAHTGSR